MNSFDLLGALQCIKDRFIVLVRESLGVWSLHILAYYDPMRILQIPPILAVLAPDDGLSMNVHDAWKLLSQRSTCPNPQVRRLPSQQREPQVEVYLQEGLCGFNDPLTGALVQPDVMECSLDIEYFEEVNHRPTGQFPHFL